MPIIPVRFKKAIAIGYLFFIAGYVLMIRSIWSLEKDPINTFFWNIRPIGYEFEYSLFLLFHPFLLLIPLAYWMIKEKIYDK